MSKKPERKIEYSHILSGKEIISIAKENGCKNISQISRYLGVDRRTVRRWMEGSNPRIDILQEVCARLGIDNGIQVTRTNRLENESLESQLLQKFRLLSQREKEETLLLLDFRMMRRSERAL